MTDKPEAVAWLYEIPGANHRYAYAQRRDCFAEGWTETPLYAHPQPDASALVEALRFYADREQYAYCKVMQGRLIEDDAGDRARAALTAWEQSNADQG